MISKEKVSWSLGDMMEWRKANDEYQRGARAREQIGFGNRGKKRDLFHSYNRSDSQYYKLGFQDTENKMMKRRALDLETLKESNIHEP